MEKILHIIYISNYNFFFLSWKACDPSPPLFPQCSRGASTSPSFSLFRFHSVNYIMFYQSTMVSVLCIVPASQRKTSPESCLLPAAPIIYPFPYGYYFLQLDALIKWHHFRRHQDPSTFATTPPHPSIPPPAWRCQPPHV